MKGIDLVELAKPHIGEQYVLGAVAPKDDPDFKGAWDCAEFASWLVYQTIKELYGCVNDNANPSVADAYTGSWKYDSDKRGIVIPVKDALDTAGAFLLRYSGGTIGHIVLCKGGGNTIEAHSANRGVIEYTAYGRRWDRGILIPRIDYDIVGGKPQPELIIYRWTQPLMSGDNVRDIQMALLASGYSIGRWGADGLYGSSTAQAVKAFQRDVGIVPDGEVGIETARKLNLLNIF